jgi:aspartyl protease family protein
MRRRLFTLAVGLGGWGAVRAEPAISLNGSLGRSAALLVIDGQVQTLRVGQSLNGVKLIEVGEDSAVVEIGGKARTLRLGAAPVAQAPAADGGKGQRIVLQAGSGGHFMTLGSINGGSVRFMVDTGATTVSMSRREADRLRLNYRNGRPVQMQTANGVVNGYLMTLDRVRVGDVEIGGVDATVAERDLPFVLLGNSFLSRFQMRRDNETLILERRY